MIKTMCKRQVYLLPVSHWWVRVGCNLVPFVLFVMMSTNIEKNSGVSEEGHFLTAYGFYLVVSSASMQVKSF